MSWGMGRQRKDRDPYRESLWKGFLKIPKTGCSPKENILLLSNLLCLTDNHLCWDNLAVFRAGENILNKWLNSRAPSSTSIVWLGKDLCHFFCCPMDKTSCKLLPVMLSLHSNSSNAVAQWYEVGVTIIYGFIRQGNMDCSIREVKPVIENVKGCQVVIVNMALIQQGT